MVEQQSRGFIRGARKTGLTLFGAGLGALLLTVTMLFFSASYLPVIVIGGVTAVVLGIAMFVFPGEQAIELESLSKVPLNDLMRGLGALQKVMWTLAVLVGICAGLGLHVLLSVE